MTHLDPDVLAELRAGLITGRRGARITAHLAGCDRCAALDEKLAEVTALLAAVPAPAVPESVAQRLDTVLAAEVAKNDNPERAVVRGPQEPGTHGRPARHRRSRLMRLRVLAPVAAVGVLLAAGGYGLSQIGGGPSMQAASSSAGGGASAGSAASAGSKAAAPVAGPPNAERMAPNFAVVTTSTNYKRGTFRQQLKAEIATSTSRPAQAPSGQTMACVRLVSRTVNPVFVDSARFEGQPATVIVVSISGGDRVWVTGNACSATHRDVLYTTTLRPGI
jgi:hypothetical protein